MRFRMQKVRIKRPEQNFGEDRVFEIITVHDIVQYCNVMKKEMQFVANVEILTISALRSSESVSPPLR